MQKNYENSFILLIMRNIKTFLNIIIKLFEINNIIINYTFNIFKKICHFKFKHKNQKKKTKTRIKINLRNKIYLHICI